MNKSLIDRKVEEYEKLFLIQSSAGGLEWLRQAMEEVFQEGRRSVLDEWEEDQKKLLEGFGYKKRIKKSLP